MRNSSAVWLSMTHTRQLRNPGAVAGLWALQLRKVAIPGGRFSATALWNPDPQRRVSWTFALGQCSPKVGGRSVAARHAGRPATGGAGKKSWAVAELPTTSI